jgi:hypothetical protein
MEIMRKKHIVYPVIAGVLSCLVVLAGWFILQGQAKSPVASGYMEVLVQGYGSIEEMTSDSDAVVVGTVKGIINHLVDYGKDNNLTEGIPGVLYEVNVNDVLKGDVDTTIFVLGIDTEKVHCDEASPLKDNDQVILFLKERISEEWSYIDWPSDKFYAASSMDVGVFDILSDGSVKPRAPEAFATAGEVEEPVFTLESIRADVQAAQ